MPLTISLTCCNCTSGCEREAADPDSAREVAAALIESAKRENWAQKSGGWYCARCRTELFEPRLALG
jgi:hypothetical protein